MTRNQTMTLLQESMENISSTFNVSNDPFGLVNAIRDKSVRENYFKNLSEGLDDSLKSDFVRLCENSYSVASEGLMENTSASAQLFATIDSVILREVFNRTGAREAMTYKVMSSPSIQVAFMKQWMKTKDGEKIGIPQFLKAQSLKGVAVNISFDLQTGTGSASANVFDKLNVTSQNKFPYSTTDKLTLKSYGQIVEIVGCSSDNWTGSETKIDVKIKIGQEGNICQNVTWTDSAGLSHSATLMGNVDRTTGNIIFATPGTKKIKSVKYQAVVSPETNQGVFDVTMGVEKINIAVGEGDTINSAVPTQFIQDYKALFGLDMISDITKLISEVYAQVYDQEVYNTFVEAIESDDQKMKWDASMIYNGNHIGISHQMHNASLLQMIFESIGAIDKRNNFPIDTQYFVICSPREQVKISGTIAPEYAGGVVAGGNVIHYTGSQVIGSYSGGAVKTISSKHYTDGEIYIVAKPSMDQFVCFGYYDYSQIVMPLGSYRNEQNALVPNIMFNKRKVIHTFRPEAAQQLVVNNSNQIYGAL